MRDNSHCVLCEDEFASVCQRVERLLADNVAGVEISDCFPMASLDLPLRNELSGGFNEGIHINIRNGGILNDEGVQRRIRTSLLRSLIGTLRSRGFCKNGGQRAYVREGRHIVIDVFVSSFAVCVSIKPKS